MATAASMASPQRWRGRRSWAHGAAKPCLPPSRCTQLLRAAFLTGATAEAAAEEEEKEEAVREEEEECTRTSERSWTIKPGLAQLCVCVYVCKFV